MNKKKKRLNYYKRVPCKLYMGEKSLNLKFSRDKALELRDRLGEFLLDGTSTDLFLVCYHQNKCKETGLHAINVTSPRKLGEMYGN